jgi:hypothetical protein
MGEETVRVAMPDGSFVEGVDVGIDEATERWSDVKLTDGTLLRVKNVVIQAIRTSNYDPDGNPIYVIRGAPVMVVGSVPKNLRKKG